MTWAEVVLLPLSFAGASAGVACSLVLFFDGRGDLSVVFALGGVALAFWTGIRAVGVPGR